LAHCCGTRPAGFSQARCFRGPCIKGPGSVNSGNLAPGRDLAAHPRRRATKPWNDHPDNRDQCELQPGRKVQALIKATREHRYLFPTERDAWCPLFLRLKIDQICIAGFHLDRLVRFGVGDRAPEISRRSRFCGAGPKLSAAGMRQSGGPKGGRPTEAAVLRF